ncbi:MAG: hypothetical protein EON59_13485 [Alphaproteobacteria bacterium]|nr:MAG: hypothetical protein EON59_13485 [Alphaproteobacteria bacterium]
MDGGLFDGNGVLIGTKSKAWRSDRLPLAVTGRGFEKVVEAYALEIIDAVANSTMSFDETVEGFLWILQERDAHQFSRLTEPQEFCICGISETRGPQVLVCKSMADKWFDVPFHFYEMGPFFSAVTPGQPDWFEPLGLTGSSPPGSLGGPLGVEAMTAVRQQLPSPNGAALAAGHIQYVRVTRAGTTSRIVHTWPDEIGKRVEVKR